MDECAGVKPKVTRELQRERGACSEDDRMSELEIQNRSLSRELVEAHDNHSMVIRALLRCQGLVSHFIRADVRTAFLTGEFAVSPHSPDVLTSLDRIREMMLPRPFYPGVDVIQEDPVIDFVTKLLTKDTSEPTDRRGNHLPHRQSFAAWRDFIHKLSASKYWRAEPDRVSPAVGEGSSAPPPSVSRMRDFATRSLETPRVADVDGGLHREGPLESSTYDGIVPKKEVASPGIASRRRSTNSHSSDDSSSSGTSRYGRVPGTKAPEIDIASLLKDLRFQKEVFPPPTFQSGGSGSMRKFLNSYERYFDHKYDGSEYEKAAHLANFLVGSARSAYDALRGNTTKFYKLKPQLLSWYSTERTNTRQRLLDEFHTARMSHTDSNAIYCLRLEKLASGAFPDSQQERERQLCRKFQQTAPESVLTQLEAALSTLSVFGQSQLSWTQVKRIAENQDKRVKERKMEAALDLSVHLSQPSQPQLRRSDEARGMRDRVFRRDVREPSPPGDTGNTEEEHPSRCSWCGRKGHTKNNCWRREGKCLACGDLGHFFRDCPKRQRKRKPKDRERGEQDRSWQEPTALNWEGSETVGQLSEPVMRPQVEVSVDSRTLNQQVTFGANSPVLTDEQLNAKTADVSAQSGTSEQRRDFPGGDSDSTQLTGDGVTSARSWKAVSVAGAAAAEDRIFVPVQLNGCGPFRALVDTGADFSIVPESLVAAYELGSGRVSTDVQGVGKGNVTLADSATKPDVDICGVNFGKFEFLIMADNCLSGFIILGSDFMGRYGLVLDVYERILSGETDSGSSWQLHCPTSLQWKMQYVNVPCRAQVAMTLSPNQISRVPVEWEMSDSERDSDYVGRQGLSLVESSDRSHCWLLPGLVDTRSGKSDVMLAHLGHKVVKIRPGDIVGRLSTVSSDWGANLSGEVAVVTADKPVCDPIVNTQSVVEALDLNHLSSHEQVQLRDLLITYSGVFGSGTQQIGKMKSAPHRIELNDSTPIYQRPRRFPELVNQEIEKQCKELELLDIIEPSTSDWSSPVVPVKKKDGTMRLCVDYRKLNAVTKSDRFPLPNLNDAVFSLKGIHYFTSLDLVKGYYQLEIDRDSRKYTAFSTPRAHWQFKRLSFGLKNAPAAFQREMQALLSGFPWSRVIVYIDDVLVMSATYDEHLELLQKVLETFRNHGVTLNMGKCRWCHHEVEFLGHVVSRDGLRKPEKYMKDVSNFPKPTTVKEMREFMGLVNFQRKFVPNCSAIMKPLSQSTGGNRKKSAKLKWTSEMEQAFSELRRLMSESVTLAFPDYSIKAEPLRLYTDASGEGVGACLAQHQNESLRPIAYASMGFNVAEKSYSTLEKELAAIRWAVRTFRQFLFGVEFEIHTDHQPLVYLNNMQIVNSRLARTMQELSEFSFVIRYTPGKQNLAADSLSRLPHGPPNEASVGKMCGELPVGLCLMREVPGGPDALLISLLYASQHIALVHLEPSDSAKLRFMLVDELMRVPAAYGIKKSKVATRELKLMAEEGQLLRTEAIMAFAHLFECVVLVHFGGPVPVVHGSPFSRKSEMRVRVHLQCLAGIHYNPVLETSSYVVPLQVRKPQDITGDIVEGDESDSAPEMEVADPLSVSSLFASSGEPHVERNSHRCRCCEFHGTFRPTSVLVSSSQCCCCALLDSGAQVSCVSEAVVIAAKVSVRRDIVYNVSGVGTSSFVAKGATCLEVQLPTGEKITHQFVVVGSDDIQTCFILGNDVLAQYGVVVNFRSHECSTRAGSRFSFSPPRGTGTVAMLSLEGDSSDAHEDVASDDDLGDLAVKIVSVADVLALQTRNWQLAKLKRFLNVNGERQWPKALRKFSRYADELSVKQGVLVYTREGVESFVVTQTFLIEVALILHYKLAHPGKHKLVLLTRKQVWHPRLATVIADITRTCSQCQRVKSVPTKSVPINKIITSRPFELVAVDLVSLPTSGSRAVCCLMVIDHYSKWLSVVPLRSKTSQAVCNAFISKVLPFLPKVPERLLSDNGPEFRSSKFTELLESCSIEHTFTTPNRPQSNGVVERVNRTFLELLRSLEVTRQTWEDNIPRAVICYNNTPHSGTKLSPSDLLMSIAHSNNANPPLPREPMSLWKEGNPSFVPFSCGDFVLKRVIFKGNQVINKLADRYEGPYKVSRCDMNGMTYVLTRVDDGHECRAHHSQLRRYHSPPAYLRDHPRYTAIVSNQDNAGRVEEDFSHEEYHSYEVPAEAVTADPLFWGNKSSSSSSDGEVPLSDIGDLQVPARVLEMTPVLTNEISKPMTDVWSGKLSDICNAEREYMSCPMEEYSLIQEIELSYSECETAEEGSSPRSVDARESCHNTFTEYARQQLAGFRGRLAATSSLDRALQMVDAVEKVDKVAWMSRSMAALDLATTLVVDSLVSRTIGQVRDETLKYFHRQERRLQSFQDKLDAVSARFSEWQTKPTDSVNCQQPDVRRHTRSRGPVPSLPNVQGRVLEYELVAERKLGS